MFDHVTLDDFMAHPPQPPHNFTATHSVVLPYTPSEVFDILGDGSNLEAVARLSTAVESFTPGETVTVPLPEGGIPGSRGNQLAEPLKEGDGARRTTMAMQEVIPVLGGVVKSKVLLFLCLTELSN